MANLTLRQTKGSALTIPEMDGNFEYFTGSYTNTGTITAQGFVGDLTGSVLGNVIGDLEGNADTATTASYVDGANVDGDVASATTSYNLDATSGEVVLPTAAPGTPVVGSMYYGGALEFYIYDGSAWLTGSLTV